MNAAPPLRRGYHDLLRRDILDLIPTDAAAILDLGCGTGELGKALKARAACRVDGIELSKEAAAIAATHYDTVHQDNLNRFDPSFLKCQYDAIIFGDILEHMISPWTVLKKFSELLTANGIIIASIPNVAHPFIIKQLQQGLFRYEQAGILDITHLRFFTKTTIGQLFYNAGLKITSIEPQPAKGNPIQYYVTARKPIIKTKDAAVTLVILTLNNWNFTAQCLDSIENKTKGIYKILVVDNGSTDETIERLRKDPRIFHIENDYNLGFARGFNIGLQQIDTPYFAILNNDILVTKNWLSKLLDYIDSDEKLMLIGPRSNYVSGPQMVQDAHYNDPFELETYAARFGDTQPEALTYFHRVVFFCTLFKTAILNEIGLLDEQFEWGNYEDDDYCMRVQKKGYRAAIANKVFIHHYGSRTFRAEGIDYGAAMELNKKRFMQKWGIPA